MENKACKVTETLAQAQFQGDGWLCVLTFSHINGSSHHFLEENRILVPASRLNLTAMGLGQELKSLKHSQRTSTIVLAHMHLMREQAKALPHVDVVLGSNQKPRSDACRATDLLIVLRAGAVAVPVQQRILPPYVGVSAVAGSDPTQELLQLSLEASCLLTLPVTQVSHNCFDQDL